MDDTELRNCLTLWIPRNIKALGTILKNIVNFASILSMGITYTSMERHQHIMGNLCNLAHKFARNKDMCFLYINHLPDFPDYTQYSIVHVM